MLVCHDHELLLPTPNSNNMIQVNDGSDLKSLATAMRSMRSMNIVLLDTSLTSSS